MVWAFDAGGLDHLIMDVLLHLVQCTFMKLREVVIIRNSSEVPIFWSVSAIYRGLTKRLGGIRQEDFNLEVYLKGYV